MEKKSIVHDMIKEIIIHLNRHFPDDVVMSNINYLTNILPYNPTKQEVMDNMTRMMDLIRKYNTQHYDQL